MGIERRISYEAHLNLKLIPIWGNAYKIRISLFLYLPLLYFISAASTLLYYASSFLIFFLFKKPYYSMKVYSDRK